MFAWSHTTYAEWHGIIFNFEWKRDLNYFLDHAKDAKRISANEAWKKRSETDKEFIRIYCSDIKWRNEDRRRRIKDWYADRKCSVQC